MKSRTVLSSTVQSVKNYIIFENGVWGVAPSGVRAAAPHSAPAWTPGVYAQGLCKDAKPTKQTQPFAEGKGFGDSARMPRQNAQRLCKDAKPTKRSYRDREFALFFI